MKNRISLSIFVCFFFCVNLSLAQVKIEKVFDKAITDISCETAKLMILHTEKPKVDVCKCDSNVYALLESIKVKYPTAYTVISKSKEGHVVNGASIEKDTASINKIIKSQISQLKALKKYKPDDISDLEQNILEILEKATKKAQKIAPEKVSENIEPANNNKAKNKTVAETNTNGTDYAKTFLLFFVIILILIIAFLYFQIRKFKKSILASQNQNVNLNNQNINSSNVQNISSSNVQNTATGITQKQQVSNQPTIRSNPILINNTNKSWFVVGESVIGLSHVKSDPPIPCQDNHHYEIIGNNWGIAITADGAGSAKLSQKGSEYIAKFAALKLFKDLVISHNWHTQNILPTDDVWKRLAKEQLTNLRVALGEYAKKLNVNHKDLACTVIIVIHSPKGILVTHIGDGRAGYCNDKNEWKSMMKPWKGEEANATVFVSSDIWGNDIDSYIESRVIREPITAFTLMSDGCEQASFECSKIENGTQKWSDPNLPYVKFFNPLVETIIGFKQDNVSPLEAKTKWKKFLESGNLKLAEEQDDKTIILGVLA